ncbi:MAG: hypothetical protein A2289_19900 [Deltaproteobacteria bacterium RIFOXYA12_FULL_58_15]|nr:MAG: hypothetical protein A2289_19900 [Deltaproteobacteria bacterium RIFOXYA12_FULL_58_15]OGR08890.1 MAG: hypothetical protein A2341_27570 [Deltaproteobacteria bacterium RIFOXYB12_FULL_58_9]
MGEQSLLGPETHTRWLEESCGAVLDGMYDTKHKCKLRGRWSHGVHVTYSPGTKRALISIENKRNFLDVNADVMEYVDPIFYGEVKAAAMALGLN